MLIVLKHDLIKVIKKLSSNLILHLKPGPAVQVSLRATYMAKIFNEAPPNRMILGELLEVGVEFADWLSLCDC